MSFSVVSDGVRRILTVSERYFPFSSFNDANGVKKMPLSGDMMISGLSMRSKIKAEQRSNQSRVGLNQVGKANARFASDLFHLHFHGTFVWF